MPNRNREQLQWASTGDPDTVDDTRLFAPGQLGRYGVWKNPQASAPSDTTGVGTDKEYCFVQGDSSMSVAPFPGAVLWWKNRGQAIVTTDPTNRRGQVAGVVPGTATKGKGNYFFMQTGGLATVKFIDAVTAAPDATGKFVIPSATAGKADCLAAGTAATYPAIGKSAGAYNAVAAECLVELDLPEAP